MDPLLYEKVNLDLSDKISLHSGSKVIWCNRPHLHVLSLIIESYKYKGDGISTKLKPNSNKDYHRHRQ